MNQNADIQYIRLLTDKFYHGESSPAEEQVLAKYFCETSDTEIPPDLLADAQVFRCLSSLQQNDCAVPDDLLGKLEAIQSGIKDDKMSAKDGELPAPISKGAQQKLKFFIVRISGIAAAACLIWAIITFSRHAHEQSASSGNLTAQTDTEMSNDTTDTISAPVIILQDDIKTNPSHIAQTKLRPKIIRQSATAPDVSAVESSDGYTDGFIEITDPEEARQIIEDIGNLLATNFNETDKAISTVNSSLVSYKEITKTILQ